MHVTCRTPGCQNEGISVLLAFTDPDTGEAITPDRYVCGACGQEILDVIDPDDLVPADGSQDPDDGTPGE